MTDPDTVEYWRERALLAEAYIVGVRAIIGNIPALKRSPVWKIRNLLGDHG
jgi:hypothetical protein